MKNVNISQKMYLENGEYLYLIEEIHKKDNFEMKPPSNKKIRISNLKVPYMTATIILVKKEEYIGHISALLYDNQMASFVMSGIRDIRLPDEIEKYHEKINKCDAALLVDEKYRGQKKAKELIYLMFTYLNSKEIKHVEVEGISTEVALNTYLNTGAVQIEKNKAIYYDINKLLESDIFIKNSSLNQTKK